MIKFRLEQSRGSGKRLELFSLPALAAVYRTTEGYPRKIINLCHQTVLTMIIQNKTSVGYLLVRSCANRVFHNQSISWKRIAATVAVSVCVLSIIGVLLASNPLKAYLPWENKTAKPVATPTAAPVATPAAVPVADQEEVAALPPPELEPLLPDEQSSPRVAETTPAPQPEPEPAAVENIEPEPADPTPATEVAELQKDPPDLPSTATRYSELLGKLTLQRNETLSRIIQIVYGNYNSKYFRSLILANPLIDDPDRVEVGQTIRLPAIAAEVNPQARPAWWVQVGQKDSLEAAFNFLRSYPEQAPPVRMIPYWTSEAGNQFVLVLKGIYSTKTAADTQLRQLSPAVTSEGKIVSLWNEDAVFFADPFLVNRKNRQ